MAKSPLRAGRAGLLALALCIAPSAGASELRLTAPAACAERSAIEEQVERLLGSPLGSADDVDFDVEIAPNSRGGWRVRVDTLLRVAEGRRRREIDVASCAEAVSAAAIALTMALRSAAPQPDEQSAQPAAAEQPQAAEPSVPEPPPRDAGPASQSSRGEAGVAQRVSSARSGVWRGTLGVGASADAGALPSPAPGVAIEAGVRVSSVRVLAAASAFLAQTKQLPNGHGGRFQLVVGALLACAERRFQTVRGLLCAGWEAGRLSGEGTGVSQPGSGGQLWHGPRVEGGLGLPFGNDIALFGRIGAALPLRRSSFFLGGDELVHRPANLAGRALLGLELEL